MPKRINTAIMLVRMGNAILEQAGKHDSTMAYHARAALAAGDDLLREVQQSEATTSPD